MKEDKKIQFFYIGENVFSSKWAYGQQYLKCKFSFDNVGDKCPHCNEYFGDYVTPLVVRLSSKKNIGDFIFGTFPHALVSERFKIKYEKEDELTGIKEFRDVDLRFSKKEKCELKYYYIIPERVAIKPIPIFAEYEEDEDKEYCEICSKSAPVNSPDRNEKKTYWYLSKKGLIMDTDRTHIIPDVFLTFVSGHAIYCTQKFVDFCRENNFTNFEEQIIKIEDYALGDYKDERGLSDKNDDKN